MDMTVRDTIVRKARESEYQIVNNNTVLPSKFYALTQKEYTGKRALDIILSLIGLTVLAVLFPFLALGIKLSSPGPIFFKQKRTGRGGESFLCYKVRTMHEFYEAPNREKPAVTQKGDIRVFKFGSFLRKSNLDELPQLFNVLKGDMSLVGPRPYMKDETVYWNKRFDDFYYRYAVRPGITGFAQVKGLRGGTLDNDHMRKRLDKDLIYVQKQSLMMDVKIIFGTVMQMFNNQTNAH
ncbi:sugar transferase [Gracilimonas mengyeensis]|uniref:Sugar transferase involved in LPS biosynthesis (Colanic, teichoic acid) n=1 Tax=Gracilimonas mengyeensis TaxID=1302730 RepID=A0A521FKP5_9BACT|nr:sugar transferase [Gracilimonas mengyeensis]SMO96614.1 Sugar transferase involved in LPS biosynthesis (colanic, teichoic acid) [Gracilimonas mengyeensis]